MGKLPQQKSAAEIRRQKFFPASNLTRRLVVYSHPDCLRLLDLSRSLFNFVLLIFQKPGRTNVLSVLIVSGRRGDFNSLFRKTHHLFFVKYDKFSGGQTTGHEESLFFVYAAQIPGVLSSETDSLSPTEQSGVSFEKRESDSLIISLRLNSREKPSV